VKGSQHATCASASASSARRRGRGVGASMPLERRARDGADGGGGVV
jgi:hypothetical protein